MTNDAASADSVAQACLDAYAKLPPRGKPLKRSDGLFEWTVLSGFVLEDQHDASLTVISLGTGVKCLPETRLSIYGDVLNDSHAEIIARRGFMLWCYDELIKLKETDCQSVYFERDVSSYRFKANVKLHIYVSTLPCGDASMWLLSTRQDPDMAEWFASDVTSVSNGLIRGRNGFLHKGALRTKPARPDAATTRSMSCSDKLASWSVLGVQGALLAKLLGPIYPASYVFGEVDVALQPTVRVECERALFTRVEACTDLPPPYVPTKPLFHFTSLKFRDSKAIVASRGQCISAHVSISWIANRGTEVLCNGIKHGAAITKSGAQRPSTRSRLCKASLLKIHLQLTNATIDDTYLKLKEASKGYQTVKTQLRGGADAPFAAWLVNDDRYQAFTVQCK